jgi:SNF family Na+-dependent transporter
MNSSSLSTILVNLLIVVDTIKSFSLLSRYILQRSSNITETGGFVWQLVVSLICAWIITYVCMFKGIKSSGKVVYFTALFPYVVLIILGIRGWLLPGAKEGIKFYITPNISRLADAGVWYDAAIQIFYSLGIAYGGLLTMASYNKFNTNSIRDAFVVSICNCLTSVFAGFVVFSYIGHAAYVTNQAVENTVSSGSGLAFIIYPFAVQQLPGAPFWAILFFLMLITLGLDSEFATVETVLTSFLDIMPKLRKFKSYIIAGTCVGMFLLGLPYTTRAGNFWIDLMDTYSGGFAILIVGALEFICIGWIYGK